MNMNLCRGVVWDTSTVENTWLMQQGGFYWCEMLHMSYVAEESHFRIYPCNLNSAGQKY